MKKLQNRKRMRLKEFDYSQSGYYFVTICIKNRREFFSEIVGAKSVLNEFGKIIDEVWNNLPKYYKVILDYYVIMPDHIHAIIILDNTITLEGENENHQKSLSDIIGKFKSFTTKRIRQLLENKYEFEWQKSFFDRIIRNEKELYNIRSYIQNNPLKWEIEKDYPQNIEM